MTDRKLYVRAAEVPEHSAHLFTPEKPYALRQKSRNDLSGGYVTANNGNELCILTDRHIYQCSFLGGVPARWEIVDADGNPVRPETEEGHE